MLTPRGACAAPASRPARLVSCNCVAQLSVSPLRPRTGTQMQTGLTPLMPAQWTTRPSIYTSRATHLVAPRPRMAPLQSFLGVGAPEALLVGVVALVVFGPKGLADAAKSIGGALRAFQPTIREVVEVSQDIKGTLEKELGLDELREATRATPRREPPRNIDELVRSNSSAAGFAAAASEDEDPDIEEKRKASAALAWGNQTSAAPATPASAPTAEPSASATIPATISRPDAAPPAAAAAASRGLDTMSVEDLEAELARRKAAASKPPSA